MKFEIDIIIPAIVVLALVVVIAFRGKSLLPRWRRHASLFVRLTICGLLLGAVAGPKRAEPIDEPRATLFLVDCSDSMPGRWLAETLTDIRQRAAVERGDMGLLLFARRGETALPLQRAITFTITPAVESRSMKNDADVKRRLGTDGTDIERAINSALTTLSTRNGGVIVIYSDGKETVGAVGNVTLPPGVDVQFHRFAAPNDDAAIADVIIPDHIAPGAPIPARVIVRSSHRTAASVSVSLNGEFIPALAKDFDLAAGENILALADIAPEKVKGGAVNTVEIFLQPKGEDQAKNNNYFRRRFRSTAKTTLLLVEGTPGSLNEFARILEPQEIDARRMSFDDLALETRIDAYDGVVLDGLPPASLREPVADLLDEYAAIHGGGVLLVCREKMDPIAGPMDRLLPVAFAAAAPAQPPPKKPDAPPPPVPQSDPEPKIIEAPAITLMLLIDKSGSMAGNNIALAKEACIASAATLSKTDFVAVIAFDSAPHLALDLTSADRSDYIADHIARIAAGGYTNVYSALQAAHTAMKKVTTPIKHVILLTDGLTGAADFAGLVGAMRGDGVTVSTVCVGSSDFDPVLPAQIASVGGGRFLFANDFKKVPQIFTNETRFIVKGAAKQRTPSPRPLPKEPDHAPPPQPPQKPPETPARPEIALKIVEPHDILAGLKEADFPRLSGIAPAEIKVGAQTLIADDRDAPALALWRRGIGKVAAWMSDVGGAWSDKFFEDEGPRKLLAQTIRAIALPRGKPSAPEESETVNPEYAGILYNPVSAGLCVDVKGASTAPPDRSIPLAPILLILSAILLPIDLLLRKGNYADVR